MLATEVPTPLDLAMLIVEEADTFDDGRSDVGMRRRHSPNRVVAAIARRLVTEDGAFLDALVREHMSDPKRCRAGAAFAIREWRQQRPTESQRIVIRLDLSRAVTEEERAKIQDWLDRLDGC